MAHTRPRRTVAAAALAFGSLVALMGLAGPSCTSSDDAKDAWSCVVTTGDAGGRICACAAQAPDGTPSDRATCAASVAEWKWCSYSWGEGVCRCTDSSTSSGDVPGAGIWSCGNADICPLRYATEGEACARPGVMCPGGGIQDNIAMPYCVCGDSGTFECTGY